MKYKFIIYFILILNLFHNANSIENKILIKINNEIITTMDIYNEINFLKSMNPNLQNLEDKKIFEIAKNSLIKEKIKEIDLLRNVKEVKLSKKDFEKIILNTYSKQNLNNLDDLKKFLNNFEIKVENLEKKLAINVFWNEIIVKRFSKNVSINREEIKKELLKNNKQNEYDLSEILFNLDLGGNLNDKYEEIKNSIINQGFESSALLYSASDSSSNGGKVGWIKENSLNSKIRKNLKDLSTSDFTKPILVPGGFLILKINNIRQIDKYKNLDKEIDSLVKTQTSNQLNQFSNLYFNKIKKDININEL